MTGHVYAPNALLPSFQGLYGVETQLKMKPLWRVIRISAAAMHRDWVASDISRLFLKWVEPMQGAADCFYRIGGAFVGGMGRLKS
ncbi:hypothetical protein ACQZ4Q_07210 [Agrobacterium vitis]|uniref:hypothetical protein n=1 Tax=Agrobacterium vitis TaxID=373 RepID=UPI003D2B6367